MISSEGAAVICDFGCARMLRDSLSIAKLSNTMKGTTSHLAPEVIEADDDDIGSNLLTVNNSKPSFSKESDVWAFGMTIYVCILAKLSPVYLMSFVAGTHY